MFSQPVDESRFFGRSDLLALIGKRLQGLTDGYRQNMALLGPPLVGKTSLICQVLAQTPAHAVLALYVDVRREPFAEFAQRFLAAGVAGALGAAPAQPGADTLELLLRDAGARFPQTTQEAQRLRGWVEQGRHTEAFGGLFDWLQTLTRETGRPVLVALDEFHRLADAAVRHPLAELGKRIMVEKRVMYLMVSSQPALARKMLQEQLRLLFGHFELLDVAPFDPDASRQFLRAQLADIELPETLATFLAAWTGGQPFYLDHFARRLLQTARGLGARMVTPEMLYTAALQLLCDGHGALHHHWQERLDALAGPHQTAVFNALAALARGRLTVKDLGRRCQRSPQETNRIANTLAGCHLITRQGNGLTVEDPLFRFWLLTVHEPLRWSPVPQRGTLVRHCALEVEAALREHQRQQERAPAERLIELLHAFRDDRVTIDHRLRLLPHFVDVRQEGAQVHAATRQHHWVCCLKTVSPATEGDITVFEQHCRARDTKPQRKIFIALDGLEPNATLLAKDARMWTWDRQTLNALLGLYGKQPIMPAAGHDGAPAGGQGGQRAEAAPRPPEAATADAR